MKKVVNEVLAAKNVILFIDEFHTIVGAGSAEGSMDASNILKPFLARGELQLIGATSLKNIRNISKKTPHLKDVSNLFLSTSLLLTKVSRF